MCWFKLIKMKSHNISHKNIEQNTHKVQTQVKNFLRYHSIVFFVINTSSVNWWGKCSVSSLHFLHYFKRRIFSRIFLTLKQFFCPCLQVSCWILCKTITNNKIEYLSCIEEQGYHWKRRLCWITSQISWEIGWGSEGCYLRLTSGRARLWLVIKRQRVGHPVQYLNYMSHGQNLSTTSGETWVCCAVIFEIPASGDICNK